MAADSSRKLGFYTALSCSGGVSGRAGWPDDFIVQGGEFLSCLLYTSKLANSFLDNPVSVEVARKNATADNVKQAVYHVDEADKNEAVEYLLRQHQQKQVLIFSNTKAGASRLARQLEKKGLKASAIHGDKTQAERLAVLEAFKEGHISCLL